MTSNFWATPEFCGRIKSVETRTAAFKTQSAIIPFDLGFHSFCIAIFCSVPFTGDQVENVGSRCLTAHHVQLIIQYTAGHSIFCKWKEHWNVYYSQTQIQNDFENESWNESYFMNHGKEKILTRGYVSRYNAPLIRKNVIFLNFVRCVDAVFAILSTRNIQFVIIACKSCISNSLRHFCTIWPTPPRKIEYFTWTQNFVVRISTSDHWNFWLVTQKCWC